jgi:acetoin:2,6-dichlorophenolindophenol oxidoreductase subunit beta
MTGTVHQVPFGQAARTQPSGAIADSGGRPLSYVRAFTEGLAQVMREDADVFVAGEDVAAYGGVFRMFVNLLPEFGPTRVIDTPISESATIGLGVGAAACGLRPVIDLMFSDFMAVCFDQIVNQAAKLTYMFGGAVRMPLTITCVSGGGVGGSAQHSQSWEAMLAHVPGLKVIMPASAHDAKGLIVSAVRDDNPVVMMLNKTLLGAKSAVPEHLYEVPIGSARVVRAGTDVTVIALGRMVGEALEAADLLADGGISAEVLDLRSVQPLDSQTILDSVTRTHRALVVHEAVTFAGIGAEIAAQIQDQAFDYLDAPVARLGAPFAPVPFSPALENAYTPDRDRIANQLTQMLVRG